MKCRTFATRIYDYLDGTLAAPDKAEFESHRDSCARCAALMDSESQTAELVRDAVRAECGDLVFSPALTTTTPRRIFTPAGWRVAAAIAALLIITLAIPAIVRKSGSDAGDRWAQEIQVTYENGIVSETTLVSHESGAETIIHIQITYFP